MNILNYIHNSTNIEIKETKSLIGRRTNVYVAIKCISIIMYVVVVDT